MTTRGRACASESAIAPPAELPTTAHDVTPSESSSAIACSVQAARSEPDGGGLSPNPSRSGASTSNRGASAAISGAQAAAVVPGPEPCSNSTGGPEPSASIAGAQAATAARSSTFMNARDHSGMSGQPRQETMFPSTQSGSSTTVAPAFSMSPRSGGKAAVVRPFRSP